MWLLYAGYKDLNDLQYLPKWAQWVWFTVLGGSRANPLFYTELLQLTEDRIYKVANDWFHKVTYSPVRYEK
jgi:hypothetical protein